MAEILKKDQKLKSATSQGLSMFAKEMESFIKNQPKEEPKIFNHQASVKTVEAEDLSVESNYMFDWKCPHCDYENSEDIFDDEGLEDILCTCENCQEETLVILED